MRQVLLFLLASLAFAQPQLSIRGSVREGGPQGLPIAGVEVKLKEFRTVDGFVTGVLYLTAFTDVKGEFEFKPERFGDYFVEATKPGYWNAGAVSGRSDTDAVESSVTLSEAKPTTTLPFFMVQPGFLEGRVIDEGGDPLPNLTLTIESLGTGVPQALAGQARTDADGRFVSPKLQPGKYLVRIGPQQGSFPPPLDKFTEEDARKVDRDLETSYWPGGLSDRAAALPISVPSGASVNAGVLRPRKMERYRVRLRLSNADCGQPLFLAAYPDRPPVNIREILESGLVQPLTQIPCAEEVLVTGLEAGTYRIEVTNRNMRNNEGRSRWASVTAKIGPDAEPLVVDLIPAVDIPVRFTAYEGVLPADFSGRIVDATEIKDQRALIRNAIGNEFRIRSSFNGAYYLHSLRYGNQPVFGDTIRPTAGAELEVIVDNRGATVTGIVEGNTDYAFVGILPPNATPLTILTGFLSTRATPEGRFTLTNIPPGEYRVIAVQGTLYTLAEDGGAFAGALRDAERITLQRGDTREIKLKLR